MSGRVRAWQGAVRRMGVVVTAAGLLAATATTGLAQAASHGGHRGTPPRPLFHQADVKTAHQHRAVRYPRVPTWQPTATHWPAPATGTAVLASSPAPLAPGARWAVVKAPWSLGAQARAGATPVWAQPLASGVAAVRVRVLPHSVAVAAGVRGVVFTAQASVGGQGGEVRVGLDYAGFAQAYGGDYGLGLGLAELPACALSTPQVAACRAQKHLRWANNGVSQQVSAPVTLPGGSARRPVVFAAGPTYTDGGGPGGTYSATTLRASGTWAQSGSTGSFTYHYPMPVPPAAGGLTPQVGLDYDSAMVDGQTAATQVQGSWVGDGWTTPEFYIEQSFSPCMDDPEGSQAPQSTPDDCYDGPVFTLSQGGTSVPLVCPTSGSSKFSYGRDTTSQCWSSQDNGEVISHVVPQSGAGAGRGTHANDYWTLTSRDGTTYYFGLNELPGWQSGDTRTNSVDSLPVFSAHSGDPCHDSSGFGSSVCTMAYRWNLDYVTDAHGNAMAYYYDQDANAYLRYGSSTAVSYVRDSHLDHIDYGFTDGNAYTSHAPDQVTFTTAPRCDSGDGCNSGQAPDVPGTGCTAGQTSQQCPTTWPTFYSTVRLDTITTHQWDGTGWQPADSWKLGQEFPPSGDTTDPTLWLDAITRTGSDTTASPRSNTIALPSLQFPIYAADGTTLLQEHKQNRVNPSTSSDTTPPLYRYRLSYIQTDTGAVIRATYGNPHACDPSNLPADPASNTTSCFPVYWGNYTPTTATPPGLGPDWFYKYAVTSVTVSDPTPTGSPAMVTDYSYKNPAWHYDDNELVKRPYRTYGQWRGYQQVTATGGDGADVSGGEVSDAKTKTVTTYYQGMDGDTQTGQGDTVVVTDSQGGQHTDYDQLTGDVLESTTYNFDGTVDHTEVYSYYVSPAVASRARDNLPDLTANATGVVEDWRGQTLTDASPPWRVTETDTSYDTGTSDPLFGLPLYTFRYGQVAEPGVSSQPTDPSQQACTTTTYAPANTAENLVGLPAEVETDAVACGGSSPDGASVPGTGQVNALTAPASVTRPDQVISDTRTFYDDPTLAQAWPQPASPTWPQPAPTTGDASVIQQAKGYANGAFTYQTKTATVYDSYGRPVGVYDANGNLTQTAYTMTAGSTTGQTVTNPLGQATTTTLDPLRALPLTVTDPNNLTTTLQYDALGRLTAVWTGGRAPSSGPGSYVFNYQVYNSQMSNSGPTTVTSNRIDNNGAYITSATIYDAMLRPVETQTQSPGDMTGQSGGMLVSQDFYDSRGWQWKSDANVWTAGFPGQAFVNLPDSAVADQTVTSFDGLGRPVLAQSLDHVDDTTTSPNTVPTQTTAHAYYGDRTTTAQITTPACVYTETCTSSYTATAGGTPSSSVTDALGRQAELDSYTADPTVSLSTTSNDTTVGITGGTTQATGYAYGTRGWLSTITDAATGEQWSKGYNLLGRATSTTDPNSGKTQMSYDADGNLTHTTDADGNTLTYTYDALNRKTGEYDGPTTSSPQLASWVYDNANNALPGMDNPIGHLTTNTSYSGGKPYTIQQLGFTGFGESEGETDTIPTVGDASDALAGSYTATHTYNTNTGLPISDTSPCSTPTPTAPTSLSTATACPQTATPELPAETLTHEYGELDLPVLLGSKLAAYEVQIGYNPQAQVEQEQVGADNATITDSYNQNTGALTDSLVSQVTSSGAASPLDDTGYTYNAFGQVTTETDTRTPSTGTQAETQCFGYDSLGRLAQAWTATDACTKNPSTNGGATVGDQISGSAYWTSWTFDPLGDQATKTQHSLTGSTDTLITYGYNGNGTSQPNTLTSAATTGGKTATTNWTYDADGNTHTQNGASGNKTFTWSDDGKLASVTTSAGTTSYVYDAGGNLLEQKSPTADTVYLFGGAQQVTYTTATQQVTGTRFITLPGGGMAVRNGAGTDYYFEFTDAQGTSTLTLDNNLTNPVWRQYTPYGAPRGQAPTTWPDTNGFLHDPTTVGGLTIVGVRTYNPATGRFLSVDPILEPNSPQQLNGYTYAADDPTSASDPTGLMCTGGSCVVNPGPSGPNSPSCGNGYQCGGSDSSAVMTGTSNNITISGMFGGHSVAAPIHRLTAKEAQMGCAMSLSSSRVLCPVNGPAQFLNNLWNGLSTPVGAWLAEWRAGWSGKPVSFTLGHSGFIATPQGHVLALPAGYNIYDTSDEGMLARLPAYEEGGPTSGILVHDGAWTSLTSGYNGPAASIPRGTPGFNLITRAHVEGQAAAIMRNQGLEEATLYINNSPCGGVQGCEYLLPRMLPEGSQLRVVSPGWGRTFAGWPDDLFVEP